MDIYLQGLTLGLAYCAPIGLQNLFVITKYKGVDPEVYSGIDDNVYPRPITCTLGLVATF